MSSNAAKSSAKPRRLTEHEKKFVTSISVSLETLTAVEISVLYTHLVTNKSEALTKTNVAYASCKRLGLIEEDGRPKYSKEFFIALGFVIDKRMQGGRIV